MKQLQTTVFSGSSNPPLAASIAKHLGADLGSIKISKFPSGELKIRASETVAKKIVLVVQSLNQPAEEHFFELSLIVDALKRKKPEAVIAVIPWLAYSLQDEAFLKGEPVSAEVIAGFIDSLGLELIVFVDLHSRKIASYFKTPNIEVHFAEIFQEEIKKIDTKGLIVVAPDEGAAERVGEVANLIKKEMIQMIKVRDSVTGEIKFTSLKEDLRGRECLLCDDVIITGDTLLDAASILVGKGAESVTMFCTHAILAKKALEKIEESPIDKMVASDTIDLSGEQPFKKLKVINAAPAIAAKIRNHLQS